MDSRGKPSNSLERSKEMFDRNNGSEGCLPKVMAVGLAVSFAVYDIGIQYVASEKLELI